MSKYDDYRDSEDFYTPERKNRRKAPDQYEDISSDYTPEEKHNFTPRSRDFTLNRTSAPSNERKFYDDSLLKNRGVGAESAKQQQAARARQQELEERRQAEARDNSGSSYSDFYSSGYGDMSSSRQSSPNYYSGSSEGNYSSYQGDDSRSYEQFSRRKNELEDTMEGIPLAGYGSGRDVSAYGGAGGKPPRKNRRGGDGFDEAPEGRRPDKRKRKKKKHVLRTVLIVFLVLILVGAGAGYGVVRNMLGGLNQTELSDIEKLGISDAIDKKYGNQNIINFALFGIDTRDEESMEGLSDSIIIVSVNRGTGAVKMISILRDSLVPISGHGKQKITHAYSYGGPELAINTINQNFHMNIQDYATVNFAKMADIIDTLGGIDLEITPFEWEYTNGIGQSTYGRKNYEDLPAPGQVHMTGKQAVSFARIRSDSDVNRAERQRKVLNLLVEKVKSTSILKYPSLIKQLLGYVETSMTYDEILGFAPMVTKNITIEQTAMPDEELDNAKGGGDPWVWRYDLDDAADRIHRFIYENDNSAG